MRIDVFTLFPQLIEGFARESVIGRAAAAGILDVRAHDLRLATTDVHRTVDDTPSGGGAGMVLMAPPVFAAVEEIEPPRPLILMSPTGAQFDQEMAETLATVDGFSLLCGRYEGVDERIREHLIDDEISVGDYVLAGGEVAAMAVIEAVVRLVPGVLGNERSAAEESFRNGLLEHPHYTKPAEFRGWEVPEVLLSGDHAKVERWRRAQSLARTIELRPDLIDRRNGLSDEEIALLEEHGPPELS